jgi:hypothetical protein
MDRRAALLAWSLTALSMALLVGGFALSLATSTTVSDRPFGGETGESSVVANLVTLLTFSVVGTIIASRQPRSICGTCRSASWWATSPCSGCRSSRA